MVIFDWGFMGNMGYFTQRSHNDVPTFQLLDRNPMWLVLNLAYGVIRAFPEEGLASARGNVTIHCPMFIYCWTNVCDIGLA